MRRSAETRLFAVLGDPVRHSLSPRFQNAAIIAAGIDAVYVALSVTATELPTVMRTLTANGGGGNITIPHKHAAAAIAGVASARVQLLGVANLFGGGPDGSIMLGNTDVDGILTAIDSLDTLSEAWLLLGTGGSARAVAGAALERGVALGIRSRDPARALEFTAWARQLGLIVVPEAACTIAVNATPLGLGDADPFPAQPKELPSLRAVLDLTYRVNGLSRWVLACREAGLAAVDGREVLLSQGAASWRLWFPGVTPPIEVMRAALNGCLD